MTDSGLSDYLSYYRRRSGIRQGNKAGKMPHKQAKAVGKLYLLIIKRHRSLLTDVG